jgi:hypothetical protein
MVTDGNAFREVNFLELSQSGFENKYLYKKVTFGKLFRKNYYMYSILKFGSQSLAPTRY